MTEWRCLLRRKHEGPHVFEPDTWRTAPPPTPNVDVENLRNALKTIARAPSTEVSEAYRALAFEALTISVVREATSLSRIQY
jgi:hypothetical protein